MPSIDMPYEELVGYRPALTAEADFDAFWRETLAEARAHELLPVLNVMEYPVKGVLAHQLSYAGFGGARVHGLYLAPRGADADHPVPVVICYHGYSGNAGMVHQLLPWVMLGCAVVAVDTRGQGGQTGDPGGYSGGSVAGWMTQGILDPQDYYYRRAYTDCVRAVDFVAERPEIDAEQIVVTGGSQGGGLTIAVAGLEPRVRVAMPDVPFLCHYTRATRIACAGPYLELQNYFQRFPNQIDQAHRTLSYFDGMNLASRVAPDCQMLWSVGLWDDVCPPSTVFAAYNHCPPPESDGTKEMAVYPYNKHEGGGGAQFERKLAFAAQVLARRC